MTHFIVIGSGGHARVLVEALRARGSVVHGFVSDTEEQATGVMRSLTRLGSDRELIARGPDGVTLINGIGSTGKPARRIAIFETFRAAGFNFATVIHPHASVALDAKIGEGAQIMAGGIVQTGATIGMNTIVNTGAIIDHDASIGDHVHVAPGATLAGDVAVAAGSHIGAGATVIQGVRVGQNSIVAAGAVVIEDVDAETMVVGVPARTRRRSQRS